MQNSESDIYESSREPVERSRETLSQRFNGRLRVIARQSVTYWFSQDKLDKLSLMSFIAADFYPA